MPGYSIIPPKGFPEKTGTELNHEAICFFVACGFFPAEETYWKDVTWDLFDFDNNPWTYKPQKRSLQQSVDLFASIYHEVLNQETKNKRIILPLSGGLDSRCLAAGLNFLGKKAHCFSYKFHNSFDETKYGKIIAQKLKWDFDEFTISPGYLWDKIEEAADTNLCYSEFTHPRQLAVAEDIAKKGDAFLLGHWGDVLFDDMGIEPNASDIEILATVKRKILKKGGAALASKLWEYWGIDRTFDDYLDRKISDMLSHIKISDANAKVRAFKSTYWATRWTSVNLAYYKKHSDILLPFYHDNLANFVMTTPEEHLAGRQIQIEYLKRYAPELAKIPWQDTEPFNLYNYQYHRTWRHIPFRLKSKIKREFRRHILNKKQVTRNWEIQFLGIDNRAQLENHLGSQELRAWIGDEIIDQCIHQFYSGSFMKHSHPLSTLLTLKMFIEKC